MLKVLIPAVLSTSLVLPIADGPPTLAVEPGCRASARADPMMQITVETCMAQERSAQNELRNKWATFSAVDRGHCQRLTNIGGMPSYVEFLTCLEMSRDARQLRQQQPATQGLGATPDINR